VKELLQVVTAISFGEFQVPSPPPKKNPEILDRKPIPSFQRSYLHLLSV